MNGAERFGRQQRRPLPTHAVPVERHSLERGQVTRVSRAAEAPVGVRAIAARIGNVTRETHEPDYVALVSIVALAAIGILMVYSASAIPAYAQSLNTFQLVGPQIAWCLLGFVAMFAVSRIDYRYLRALSVPLYVLALAMLVGVFLPVIGVRVNNSARWLQFPGLPSIHAAEVAKLALVVYLSHWLATRGKDVRSLIRGTIPFAIIVAPMVILVAREPDLGTTAVIGLTVFTLFFIAGANLFHLALGGAAGLAGGVFLIFENGYPLSRIQALLDPWSDRSAGGFQTIAGLTALGLGGLFGTGLGNNRVTVPGDFNDFIFSVIAQELGLVGGVVVIGLFVAFAFAGIRTALRAPDTFGALLAAGVTAWISFQALINIGVVLVVVPVTGITLPFVSAGGSSLVISFAAVGVLLSVSRETVERGSMHATDDRGGGYGRTHLPGSGRRPIAARPPVRS